MKKAVFIIVLILMSIIIFIPKSKTAYSGVYYYNGQTNIVLNLKGNNSFTLEYSYGKNIDTFNGKYSVKNNDIHLSFDNSEAGDFFKNISYGTFKGSDISLNDSGDTFIKQ